jgi:hypothetical protein
MVNPALVWVYETNLNSPLLIEVSVSSQESEGSCVCVLEGINIACFYDLSITGIF